MVDTTCPNARKLHYARANFKNNFDITNINATSPPLLEYVSPGSVGEKGDNRQYSFLMYMNPGRKEITDLQLPGADETFEITQFQNDNGLGDAMAGVGMVVKLGGQADCTGDSAEVLPSSLPTPRPAKTTTIIASRTAGGGNATASATPTDDTNVPGDAGSPSSATATTPSSISSSSLIDSSIRTGSSLQSQAADASAALSTIVLSDADATSSPTAATTEAEQTTNAASETICWPRWAVVSFLVVVSSMVIS
jgi:hypothetical protein